jgi:hypothetical protein
MSRPTTEAAMIELQRVFLGTRSQLLAASYQLAVSRAARVSSFQGHAARFMFDLHHFVAGELNLVVLVDTVDELHARVRVRALPYDLSPRDRFGIGRRAATRFLDALESEWSKPLRAMAEPGWYPDVTGRFGHRYWDGVEWTPWVWQGDTLWTDHPHRSGSYWVRVRRGALRLGQPMIIIDHDPRSWLEPPLYAPARLRSRGRRWRNLAREQWRIAIPLTVGLAFALGIAALIAVRGSNGEPRGPSTVHTVGGVARYPDGAEVVVLAWEGDTPGSRSEQSVLVKVCAGRRSVRVGAENIIVTGFRRDPFVAHPSTAREPALRSGDVPAHQCTEGWVAVGTTGAPVSAVSWGDEGRPLHTWYLFGRPPGS